MMLDRDRPQASASQCGVLQLACAVVQAMEGDIDKSWDRLATVEKVRRTCTCTCIGCMYMCRCFC